MLRLEESWATGTAGHPTPQKVGSQEGTLDDGQRGWASRGTGAEGYPAGRGGSAKQGEAVGVTVSSAPWTSRSRKGFGVELEGKALRD